jgi:uncharacterized Rmd1/YagE family protein
MKNLHSSTPKDTAVANQKLIRLKKQLDKYKLNQAITNDIDDDYAELAMMNYDDHVYYTTDLEEIFMADYYFNPRDNYDLKEFFGLLTEHEKLEKFRLMDYQCDFMGGLFIDYDTLQQLTDDEAEIIEFQDELIYDTRRKILVTVYSNVYQVYKIGSTIDDCIFIGSCSNKEEFYGDYFINDCILRYLNTGMYGFYA